MYTKYKLTLDQVIDDLLTIKKYFQENSEDCYPLALDIAVEMLKDKWWKEISENVQFSEDNELNI